LKRRFLFLDEEVKYHVALHQRWNGRVSRPGCPDIPSVDITKNNVGWGLVEESCRIVHVFLVASNGASVFFSVSSADREAGQRP
jgi:hypothetical protein